MSGIPKIGAFVLETLTTGMYTNPLDSLREFVQNGADSIRAAEAGGFLSTGEGRIRIILDPSQKTLKIRDNGLGVPAAEINNRLVNVGMSQKRIDTDAGFRGIGRLAGIAYCNKLSFSSSAPGEQVVTHINIDAERLRRSISPAVRASQELSAVLAENTQQFSETSSSDEHFFEVTMEGLDSNLPFVDAKEMEEYLSQVAPVGFDAHRFTLAPKITDWMRKFGFSLPTVTMILKTPNGEREIFKPYRTHSKTAGRGYEGKIKDIHFFPDNPSSSAAFWMWYARPDVLGTIADERVAGIRVRKHNIGLGGPGIMTDIFKTVSISYARFNSYFVGEVHIVSSSVIPNARRDGLEDSKEWVEISNIMRDKARTLSSEVYQQSRKNSIAPGKITMQATRVLEEAEKQIATGFVSSSERDTLIARVEKAQEQVVKSIEESRSTGVPPLVLEVGAKLEQVHRTLEQDNNYAGQKLRSNLDRKQRKVVEEILQVLHEVLDETNFIKAKGAIMDKFGTNSA